MDIQNLWDSFVNHLKTKGIVKIGRNSLGVITNVVRESGCSLGYNDIELMWETWQAAQKVAVPKWISIKDKLPAFNQRVLSSNGFEICIAEYLEFCTNEHGFSFEEGFWVNGAASLFEDVTHWMPLPEIEAQEPTND